MDARIRSGHDESGSGIAAFEKKPWEETDDRQSSVEPHHGPVESDPDHPDQHEE
jgi:hypothetical protein